MKHSTKKTKSRPHSKPAGLSSGERPIHPIHKWLFRLVAVMVVPLILLGAIEAGLRLAGYGYDPALFKKITIAGDEFFVNNEAFGLRFFPPQLMRGLGPVRMPVQKPAGTYRIFILGESAAMGDPEPAYGASRYLEVLLSKRYPQTHFEVINLGITAINSHVILPIARGCARCQGDLWIIYMGNNEMVGPFGAATVFGAKTPPLPLIRLNLAVQKTRLGQLLVNITRKFGTGKSASSSWGGMEMFAGNQIPVNDPRRDAVYRNFSRNLHDILKAGLDSGAKILLNTVAVNLKDCAPFASLSNGNLPSADRIEFDRRFQTGVKAQNQGDFAQAAQEFESASRLDPTVAELQYRLGQSLLALTNDAAAGEHLKLACDDDALPFRADSRINALIAATDRQMAGYHLVLFDAAGALSAQSPSGLCGDETFFEHVHFNFDGNYRLGLAWAKQVAAMLPPEIARAATANGWVSQTACEQRLGLSDWNRSMIFQQMVGRLQQPPLSGQLNALARIKQLEKQVDELSSRMTTTAAVETRAIFQTNLLTAPDDYLLRESYAAFLQMTGDLPQAAAEWQRIHEQLPHDYLPYFELGRMFELQGEWAEAETHFQRAVQLRPTLTEGWIELGNALASQGKFEPAIVKYSTAHEQRPQDSQVVFRRGKALARLNRHAEAMDDYRAAIKLNPADWEPHYELGGELDANGQLDAARMEFGEAVRLNPQNARAHFNYGVLLAKQNQLKEARHEFEETLRLEPGYSKAQEYLMQVKTIMGSNP